jgi:hypothetical protein
MHVLNCQVSEKLAISVNNCFCIFENQIFILKVQQICLAMSLQTSSVIERLEVKSLNLKGKMELCSVLRLKSLF